MTSMHNQNVETVRKFYDALVNQKNFDLARTYTGPTYTQHNPAIADGLEGLRAFVEMLKQDFPEARSEIKKAFAVGDHVFLLVHNRRFPDARGRAIADLFRLENGKLVEHWDVIQDIPEASSNQNGMF